MSKTKSKKYYMMIEETQATFPMTTTKSYDEACAYMEENYGDPSETCMNYPCFKGVGWDQVKKLYSWDALMRYIEHNEGLSVSCVDEDEEREINPE